MSLFQKLVVNPINNQKSKIKECIANKTIELIHNNSFMLDKNKAFFTLKEYLEDDRIDTTLKYRKKPDDYSLGLRKIRLIIPFEAEEFYKTRQIIRNIFPNIETINKLLSDIEKEEASLNALNWRNIGILSKKATQQFGFMYSVENLPAYCDTISVSYMRVTASISILSFEFNLQEDFDAIIENIQNTELKKKIIFNKFFPFRLKAFKLSLQYGFSTIKESSATKYVRQEIDSLKVNLQDWIFEKSKVKLSAIGSLEIFTINEKDEKDFELYNEINKHQQWLYDYGVSRPYIGGFYNDKICFTGEVSN